MLFNWVLKRLDNVMKCKIVVVVYRSMFSSIVSNRPCREHWLVLESAVKLSQ